MKMFPSPKLFHARESAPAFGKARHRVEPKKYQTRGQFSLDPPMNPLINWNSGKVAKRTAGQLQCQVRRTYKVRYLDTSGPSMARRSTRPWERRHLLSTDWGAIDEDAAAAWADEISRAY